MLARKQRNNKRSYQSGISGSKFKGIRFENSLWTAGEAYPEVLLLTRHSLERFLKLLRRLFCTVETHRPSSFPRVRQNFDDRCGWIAEVLLWKSITKVGKGLTARQPNNVQGIEQNRS
jgi:hypothetical protein